MDADLPEEEKPEIAELPKTWKALPDGALAPNWVAAVQEARNSETRAINEGRKSETVPLPDGWRKMASGEPMPDVAAAVRHSRDSH